MKLQLSEVSLVVVDFCETIRVYGEIILSEMLTCRKF